MRRAQNKEQKRSKTPKQSFFKSAPKEVMVPRLMVIMPVVALLVLGLVMVYSASSIFALVEQGNAFEEALKQILFAAVGIGACIAIVKFCNEDTFRGTKGLAYWGICIVLILLTALMGTVGLGAKRWLVIGGVGIQGSEFAKIAFALMTARFFAEYTEGIISRRQAISRVGLFVLLPLIFLFFTQSDLGTTIICLIAIMAVLWLGGLDIRLIALLFVGIGVLGVAAITMQGYRSDRMIFLDPWSDPQGAGYQLIHSFKALASGGIFGSGVGNSYEKMLYLPEAETDFIFAILGEELGLVGTLGVVVLFLIILIGGLEIACQASTSFGTMLAGSLTIMLVFQAFLNILCVIGSFPTTGKPLPFISSGGSSLISSLMIIGVILSVSFNSHKETDYQKRRENLHVVSSYRRSREGISRKVPPVPHPSGGVRRHQNQRGVRRSVDTSRYNQTYPTSRISGAKLPYGQELKTPIISISSHMQNDELYRGKAFNPRR